MDDNTTKTTITTRTIEISIWKAVGILATSILSAAGVAIFSTVRILQSDHYVLMGLGHRVTSLEAKFTEPEVIILQFESVNRRLDRIESKVDQLK